MSDETAKEAILTAAEREALLDDVKKTIRKQARPRARIRLPWVRIMLVLLIVAAAAGAFFGVKGLVEGGSTHRGEGIFDVEDDVEDKDITFDNQGVLGYTAADFAEVVLGDTTTPKRLEVFSTEVSDTATITEAGLANLTIFSKVQDITFNGVATYAINLANINQYCFVVDNDARVVTVYVPHATLTSLNIPASRMEFGDVERGVLAFGEIKLTPEDQAALEAAAQTKMEQKLVADRVQLRADEAGVRAVHDVYAPLIAKVAPGYSLVVEFMG